MCFLHWQTILFELCLMHLTEDVRCKLLMFSNKNILFVIFYKLCKVLCFLFLTLLMLLSLTKGSFNLLGLGLWSLCMVGVDIITFNDIRDEISVQCKLGFVKMTFLFSPQLKNKPIIFLLKKYTLKFVNRLIYPSIKW